MEPLGKSIFVTVALNITKSQCSVSLDEDDPDNAIWFDFIQRLKDSESDGVFHDLHTYPDCDAPD